MDRVRTEGVLPKSVVIDILSNCITCLILGVRLRAGAISALAIIGWSMEAGAEAEGVIILETIRGKYTIYYLSSLHLDCCRFLETETFY